MTQDVSLTGAALLIDALQANGLNNMYGVVGIPVTDFARLAELKGMKFYGFRREDAAVDAAAASATGWNEGKANVPTQSAYRVDRAEDMGLAVARAVRTAMSGRPGGVYLDLPAATVADTVAQKSDAHIYEVVDPAPKQLPLDDAIERAVELLKNAKHPAIILGKGSAYARSEAEVEN